MRPLPKPPIKLVAYPDQTIKNTQDSQDRRISIANSQTPSGYIQGT